jgi:hypothetical protein
MNELRYGVQDKGINYSVKVPDGNRPLGRSRHRWEDITIDLKWDKMVCTRLILPMTGTSGGVL